MGECYPGWQVGTRVAAIAVGRFDSDNIRGQTPEDPPMIRILLALALAATLGLAAEDPLPRPQALPFSKDDVGKVATGWAAAHTRASERVILMM